MVTPRISPTRIVTKITAETSHPENPFITDSLRTHGYDTQALSTNISFSQMIFLAFMGELPTPEQHRLLDHLLVSLSNPGPRNGAVRAAMTAAISKTAPEHLLPIGLHVLGGGCGGFAEVVSCAAWLSTHKGGGSCDVIPGFGTMYGGKDVLTEKHLLSAPGIDAPDSFMHIALQIHMAMPAGGILDTGYCAALGLDLGFGPRECGALFQLARSVGILAHAMEQTHYPISASTLLDDEHYEYNPR